MTDSLSQCFDEGSRDYCDVSVLEGFGACGEVSSLEEVLSKLRSKQ